MKTGMKTDSSCPDVETLSQFVDGDGDPLIEKHLEACEMCRRTVKAFRDIDGAIQSVSAPPAGLADRISAHCRNMPDEKQPMLFAGSPLLKIAAAVAVVAAVTVLVTKPGQNNMVADKGDGNDNGSQAVATAPTHRPGPLQGMPPTQPITNIAKVGTQPEGRTSAKVPMQPITLPSMVKHVWAVDGLEQAKTTFLDALPEGVTAKIMAEHNGRAVYQLFVKDEALQSLVDALDRSGWALLSPAAPQPGLAGAIRVQGRTIRYDVDLVQSR